MATRDEEHAVSSVRHGPVKPRLNEMRPEAIDRACDVALYALRRAAVAIGDPEALLSQAVRPPIPRNTPT